MLFQLLVSPISEKQEEPLIWALFVLNQAIYFLFNKVGKESINLQESTFNFEPHELIYLK